MIYRPRSKLVKARINSAYLKQDRFCHSGLSYNGQLPVFHSPVNDSVVCWSYSYE
jgi:hypothetical protein